MDFNTFSMYATVNDAWEDLFNQLKGADDKETSRDGDIVGEIIDATAVINDPTRNIVTSPLRKLPMRYAIGELLWYLSGSNRLADIAQFSKVWERLSDDGETCNSAYGHRIFTRFGFDQWEFCKQKLKLDQNTRQAVIHIKDASNALTKDFPCTVSLQFFIRDKLLYMIVYMRSNDIWTGFPYDVFTFTCLQMKMAMELGVGIGTYTHHAGSLHLYARNLKEPTQS